MKREPILKELRALRSCIVARLAIRDAEKRKLKKEAGTFDIDAYRMGDGK